MARHKVEITGVNTANLKVLSNEEMIELFKKVSEGDKFAHDDLVNGNLKLVLSILRKYTNRCDNLDDLFQVGCIGLIKAIDNFDISFDVKFSTYAVPMILGEVKRYLRDNSSIRVARSIKDIAYRAFQVKEELTNEFNREPNNMEIAKKLGINEYEVTLAFDSVKDIISISEPIYNDGGDTIYLIDQIEDKKSTMKEINEKVALNDAINNLKDKEKYIIMERYIYGKTQMELADEIGISQAQISRIEKNALREIKNNIT